MSANSELHPVQARGWQRGLANSAGSVFSEWWGTRSWLVQSVIWTGVLAGIQLMMVFNTTPADRDLETFIMLFAVFAGMFVPVAVVIVMQDAIVGEKQTGTAAWVLSKPLSRSAFILSKFYPNLISMVISMLIIPSVFVFVLWGFVFDWAIQPLPFIAGLGLLAVNLMFFQALTLMLGAFFNHRGPVIGIPLAFLFLQQNIVGMLPALRFVLPFYITLSSVESENALFYSAVTGEPYFSWLPLISTILLSLLFVGIAIWRFNQEEF
jgi:ABC-2 type transport system permease protein